MLERAGREPGARLPGLSQADSSARTVAATFVNSRALVRDLAGTILAKEHQQESQNLEELENEHIKDSLTTLMLTVAEKGFGKRTPLAEYRITSRGGKGVVNMKTTDRNGYVVATLQVNEESDVMIITHNGKVIRVHANEIREAGRSTQGVRLLRLDDDDSVAAAAVLQEENEEDKK